MILRPSRPEWRNGRRSGLKIRRGQPRASSTLASGTFASSTRDQHLAADSLFYDLADRLTSTRTWDGRQLAFGYDSTGNLTSLTPPGQPAHTFTYTANGRQASYDPPSLGSGTWSTGYGYNLDGQLTALRRPTGDSIAFAYDTAGRPTGVAYSRGALGASVRSLAYSATTGQLTGITDTAGSSLSFSYNGMLPTAVTWSGAVAGTVSLGYDAGFRVDTITVNGSPIRLGYDNDGLLTSAGALGLTRRTDNGLLQADTLGVTGGSWSFDARGALASYAARANDTLLFREAYVRDSLGRVVVDSQTVQGTTLVRAFTYDSAGRLQDVTENGTLVRSYAHDANGNRISLTGPGLSVSGTYDAQDRILSYGTATYSHDRAGYLTEKVVGPDTTRYVYDALGNLLKVTLPDGTVIEYLVDALNRRVGRKVNGALTQGWLWQSQLAPAAELDSTGAVVSRFVYATRVNVPDYLVKGGQTYRLVLDQLGSVRLVVNTADGSVAQRLDYDEFGRVTQNTNPGFQPFGFAGGLYDDQSEMLRLGSRGYDASAGRWVNPDPIGFEGGNSNLFAYVGNDPVNLADPTGNSPWPLFRSFARGVGYGFAAAVTTGGMLTVIAMISPVASGAAVFGLALGAGWQLGITAQEVLGGYDPWTRCRLSADERLNKAAEFVGGFIGAGWWSGPAGPLFGQSRFTGGKGAGYFNTGEVRVGWSLHKGKLFWGPHGGSRAAGNLWHETHIPLDLFGGRTW